MINRKNLVSMLIFPVLTALRIHICGAFSIPVGVVILVTHRIITVIGVMPVVQIAQVILKSRKPIWATPGPGVEL